MKKISANTLQEALSQAALELECSVVAIEYEVIQYESKGFLGFGKKPAIIIVNKKSQSPTQSINPKTKETKTTESIKQMDSSDTIAQQYKKEAKQDSSEDFFDASEFIQENKKFQTKEEVLSEITSSIRTMLGYMPYKINKIEVSFYDSQTLFVYIDGEDSALLIGERGYRYKALSYLLFNWIQPTYGYNVRLEIAQFLKNQEEAIDAYLVGIINEVKREGKAQTKPLDGILAFIALKKLREHFPDKYISFRQNNQDERYIIINDFYR